MLSRKKILSLLIKILIGFGSFAIIYIRLENDFSHDKLQLIYFTVFSPVGIFCFLLCLFLIPINWGIEAYKWKLITAPIQWVSFRTATKSVYSGIFLGNLAPGRATEFLAKIIFFKIENRPKITVLHFVGGMFQLSITIVFGFIALLYKLHDFSGASAWMPYLVSGIGIVLLMLLVLSIYKINYILNFISKKVSKDQEVLDFNYKFTPSALLQLFGFSIIRYSVFFFQFFLLLYLFDRHVGEEVFPAIALYFLITTTIPMISVLEAAIRAAVALIVFKNTGVANTPLALSSIMIWLINIILPSILGYYFLLRQNFNFKLRRSK